MNQQGRGGTIFLVRVDDTSDSRDTLTFPDDAAASVRLGARLLLYEVRGEGDAGRGYATGWGEVERISSADGTTTVQLRAYTPFRRRVPFADLRADPRRDRAATIEQVNAELFNSVLAKARR